MSGASFFLFYPVADFFPSTSLFADQSGKRKPQQESTTVKRALSIIALLALASCAPHYTKTVPQHPPLYGTWWRAVDLDGQNLSFLAGQKMDIFITLSRQGRLNGSGGCNHIDATFARSGQNIRFGPIALTRMSCLPLIMSRERAFVAALRNTAAYTQDDRELRFSDRAGHTLLKFMAARRP